MGDSSGPHLALEVRTFTERYSANLRVRASITAICIGIRCDFHRRGTGGCRSTTRIVVLKSTGSSPNRVHLEESGPILLVLVADIPITRLEYE